MADETLGAAQYRSRQEQNQSDPAGVMGWKLGDRYEVQMYLGGGGFSWVYKAWDHVLNINVAAKVMKGGASFSDEDFRREALLQAKFSARHDNAVHVYAYGIDRGRPWLAMQLCDGRTLHELIQEYRQKGERIPRETMLLFVNELTKVLGAAHADNLIHRDLKPNNIMLVHEGTPAERFKLMDFGLSSKVDAEMDETIRNYTKASWGTPEYMSPEQIQAVDSKDTASPQSDIYSLGVILYEILTGHVPFPLVDYSPLKVAECQLAVVQTAPETVSRASEFGDIPPKAEQVVMECLAKKPEDRPASMQEVRERFLEAFAPSLDIPMTSISLSRRNAIMAGATVLGLLAALGILAYALLHPGNSSDKLEFTFDNLEFQFERGETRTEEISLFGNLDGTVTLEVIPREPRPENVSYPEEIQFHRDPEHPEIRRAELPIEVARDAAEGEYEFELRADTEHEFMQAHLSPLTLEIVKPTAPCPAGFEPVAGDDSGSEFQWIRDRAFYRQLDYVVNGEKVRFVLVESEAADTSSEFFYIMERPVWISLYEQFAKARNIPESERYYQSNEHGVVWEITAEQPVTNLTYREAYDFAVWMSQLHPQNSKLTCAFDIPTVPGQIDVANKAGRILPGQIAALETRGDDFFEFTSSGFRVYRSHETKLPFKKHDLTPEELEGDNVFVYSLKFDEADPRAYWDKRDRATGFRLIVEFIE